MNPGPLVQMALAIGIATAALAQDRTALPSSGSIKIHSGWRANGEGVQVAENHLLYSGVVWGVTFNDAGSGPLHMGQAVCALASETTNGGGTGEGHCAWGNADGKSKILTSFSGKVSPTGVFEGTQQITGGTGEFNGIQGQSKFHCQLLNDKGQYVCDQQFEYRLAAGTKQ